MEIVVRLLRWAFADWKINKKLMKIERRKNQKSEKFFPFWLFDMKDRKAFEWKCCAKWAQKSHEHHVRCGTTKSVRRLATQKFQIKSNITACVLRVTQPGGEKSGNLRWGCVKIRLAMKLYTTSSLWVEWGKHFVVGRVGYSMKFAVVSPAFHLPSTWKRERNLLEEPWPVPKILSPCIPSSVFSSEKKLKLYCKRLFHPSVYFGMFIEVVCRQIGGRVAFSPSACALLTHRSL